jgi:hypothetical protein
MNGPDAPIEHRDPLMSSIVRIVPVAGGLSRHAVRLIVPGVLPFLAARVSAHVAEHQSSASSHVQDPLDEIAVLDGVAVGIDPAVALPCVDVEVHGVDQELAVREDNSRTDPVRVHRRRSSHHCKGSGVLGSVGSDVWLSQHLDLIPRLVVAAYAALQSTLPKLAPVTERHNRLAARIHDIVGRPRHLAIAVLTATAQDNAAGMQEFLGVGERAECLPLGEREVQRAVERVLQVREDAEGVAAGYGVVPGLELVGRAKLSTGMGPKTTMLRS